MDLAQHAAVLWRFRAVVAGGLVLGIVLAVWRPTSFPSLTPRGSETWTSESSLLVTQSGFPEGRVRFPTDGRRPGAGDRSAGRQRRRLEFADPEPSLRAREPLRPARHRRPRPRPAPRAAPSPRRSRRFPVEGNASTQLPVIKLTTTAGSGRGRARAQPAHVEALQNVLATEQAKNAIPAGQRIQHRPRSTRRRRPSRPRAARTPRRSWPSCCALLGAVALAHLLAALRDGREDTAGRLDGVRRALGRGRDHGDAPDGASDSRGGPDRAMAAAAAARAGTPQLALR